MKRLLVCGILALGPCFLLQAMETQQKPCLSFKEFMESEPLQKVSKELCNEIVECEVKLRTEKEKGNHYFEFNPPPSFCKLLLDGPDTKNPEREVIVSTLCRWVREDYIVFNKFWFDGGWADWLVHSCRDHIPEGDLRAMVALLALTNYWQRSWASMTYKNRAVNWAIPFLGDDVYLGKNEKFALEHWGEVYAPTQFEGPLFAYFDKVQNETVRFACYSSLVNSLRSHNLRYCVSMIPFYQKLLSHTGPFKKYAQSMLKNEKPITFFNCLGAFFKEAASDIDKWKCGGLEPRVKVFVAFVQGLNPSFGDFPHAQKLNDLVHQINEKTCEQKLQEIAKLYEELSNEVNADGKERVAKEEAQLKQKEQLERKRKLELV
jgi:hypothetical protein